MMCHVKLAVHGLGLGGSIQGRLDLGACNSQPLFVLGIDTPTPLLSSLLAHPLPPGRTPPQVRRMMSDAIADASALGGEGSQELTLRLKAMEQVWGVGLPVTRLYPHCCRISHPPQCASIFLVKVAPSHTASSALPLA